jgi:hypothetical protein
LTAFYFAVCSMTTVGYGDIVPTTHLERLIVCMTTVLGALIYATIFGTVSMTLSTLLCRYTQYQATREQISSMCDAYRIPTKLRALLYESFDASFRLKKGVEMETLMDQFAPALRCDVSMCVGLRHRHGICHRTCAIWAPSAGLCTEGLLRK